MFSHSGFSFLEAERVGVEKGKGDIVTHFNEYKTCLQNAEQDIPKKKI